MSESFTTGPDCRCGHSKAQHDDPGFAPQCVAVRCECLRYRPSSPVIGATATATNMTHLTVAAQPTVEQILAAGKRSGSKRTAALAERIAGMVSDLRGRLADERVTAEKRRAEQAAKEQARREVAALEEQLRAARAKLRGETTGAPAETSRERQPCPDCGQSFANVGAHRAQAHGYRKVAS